MYYNQHRRVLIIIHVFYYICVFCSYVTNIITIRTAALFHTDLCYDYMIFQCATDKQNHSIR